MTQPTPPKTSKGWDWEKEFDKYWVFRKEENWSCEKSDMARFIKKLLAHSLEEQRKRIIKEIRKLEAECEECGGKTCEGVWEYNKAIDDVIERLKKYESK